MHYTIPGDSQLLHSSFFIFLPLLLVPPLHFSSYAKNTPKGRVSSWNSRKIKDKGDREKFVIRIYPFLFFFGSFFFFFPTILLHFLRRNIRRGRISESKREREYNYIHLCSSFLYLCFSSSTKNRRNGNKKNSGYKERFIIYRIRIRPLL